MESVYPHENLKNLYTKTTVSELKKAGMEEAAEEAYHLLRKKSWCPTFPALSGRKKRSADRRRSAYHNAGAVSFCGICRKLGGRLPAERLTRQR